MDYQEKEQTSEQEPRSVKKDRVLPVSILISALIIAGAWIYTNGTGGLNNNFQKVSATASLKEKISPQDGVVLPIKWGDLGQKLTENGVIDARRFQSLLESRGEFTEDVKNMLDSSDVKNIRITSRNAGALLNLFWALGLSNKNEILERGQMTNPAYGGAGNFASTGGWTMAVGGAMDHYSAHEFVSLTPEQEALVREVSHNIFRPCCDNPTDFPDCNHGMAMLGLLELMAAQGATKTEMYKTALAVNAYWFPDQYLTIAKYLASKNIEFDKVSPEKVLSSTFSSASGFAQVQSKITEPEDEHDGGGSCGV